MVSTTWQSINPPPVRGELAVGQGTTVFNDASEKQGQRDDVAATHTPLVDFGELASFASTLFSSPETLYRTLIEQIPAMTYISSPDDPGRLLFCSPQIAHGLGFTQEEWLASPQVWESRIHPDDVEGVRAATQQAIIDGDSYSMEYRAIHREGYPIWIHDRGILIRDNDGVAQFWLGFAFDISEQKHAEVALREAEVRYRTLVEQIPVVAYIEYPDSGGLPHYLSPKIESLLGYPLAVWQEHPGLWIECIHPEDRPAWQLEIERTNETGERFDLEFRMVAAGGHTVWVRSSAELVRDDDGSPRFWQGIIQDITDEVIAEQRLAESEQRYRSLFDHNPDFIYSADLHGRLLSVNDALVKVSGYTRDELVEMSYEPFVAPEDIERIKEHFAQVAQGIPQNYECRIVLKSGEMLDIGVTNLPIFVGGEIVGVYGIAKDVSERKALEQQLRHQAFHDPLTDLPNRLLFMDRLQHALAGLKRTSRSLAVLFVDLDNFKVFNDSFGHEIGDQMLIEVAAIIESCIRPTDTASRLGGDEYTVLLTDINGVDEAIGVARRMMRCFEQPVAVGGFELAVTPSIGIIVSSNPDDEPADILRNADLAMYQAKAQGKARYEVFTGSSPSTMNGIAGRRGLQLIERPALD